jgi:hypothetical protein
MSKFIVVSWMPLDSKREVELKEFENIEEAKDYAHKKKLSICDVVIAENLNKVKGGKKIYKIQKYGYYKIYNIMNLVIGLVLVSCLIFCYLYLVFFKK